MVKFILIDDKTDVSAATMHANGRKRLHLAGVGGDRKALNLQSTKLTIVTARPRRHSQFNNSSWFLAD